MGIPSFGDVVQGEQSFLADIGRETYSSYLETLHSGALVMDSNLEAFAYAQGVFRVSLKVFQVIAGPGSTQEEHQGFLEFSTESPGSGRSFVDLGEVACPGAYLACLRSWGSLKMWASSEESAATQVVWWVFPSLESSAAAQEVLAFPEEPELQDKLAYLEGLGSQGEP